LCGNVIKGLRQERSGDVIERRVTLEFGERSGRVEK
jgi:hypothetical protein